MKRFLTAFLLAILLAVQPLPARAASQGDEVGLALGATALNLIYIPVKLVLATGGLVAGGVAGLLTGGDTRAAYAIWVPSAGGTLVVTPSTLDGTESLEFFGSDYSDRPSTYGGETDGGQVYESAYSAM